MLQCIIPIIVCFLKLLSLRLFSRGITFKFILNRILWELSINNGYVLLILCKTNLQCSQIFFIFNFDEYILHLFYANTFCSSLHLYLINISYKCNASIIIVMKIRVKFHIAAYRFALNYNNNNNEWDQMECHLIFYTFN